MYKNVVTGKNEKFKFPSIHTIKHSLFNYTRFCQFLKTRAHVQAKILRQSIRAAIDWKTSLSKRLRKLK